jgi:hypothetical protein
MVGRDDHFSQRGNVLQLALINPVRDVQMFQDRIDKVQSDLLVVPFHEGVDTFFVEDKFEKTDGRSGDDGRVVK